MSLTTLEFQICAHIIKKGGRIPFLPPNINRCIGFFHYIINQGRQGLSATGNYGLSIFGKLV